MNDSNVILLPFIPRCLRFLATRNVYWKGVTQPPEGLWSVKERRADLVGGLALHRRGDVAVEVGEQRGISVAEAFCRHLGRHAVGEHECGAGVPEAVRSQPRQPDLGRHPAEELRQVGRVVGTARRAGEDVIAIDVP